MACADMMVAFDARKAKTNAPTRARGTNATPLSTVMEAEEQLPNSRKNCRCPALDVIAEVAVRESSADTFHLTPRPNDRLESPENEQPYKEMLQCTESHEASGEPELRSTHPSKVISSFAAASANTTCRGFASAAEAEAKKEVNQEDRHHDGMFPASPRGEGQSYPHVIVRGESGVGKSSVIDALLRLARKHGIELRVHEGLPDGMNELDAIYSHVDAALLVWEAALAIPLSVYVTRHMQHLFDRSPPKGPREQFNGTDVDGKLRDIDGVSAT